MNHIKLLNLKPAETKYSEPCGNGLYLIVYPSGRKTWSVHKRIGGKVITKALGDFPRITEKVARAAMDALEMTKENPTMREVMKRVFDLKIKNGRISPKYSAQNQRRFNAHLPALSEMTIDAITAPLAIAHLQPLADKTQSVAQKMAQILKECEIFAVNTGLKNSLCLQGISTAFPSASANIKHRTACHPSRFDEVLSGLARSKYQHIIMFGIYTLLRISEIVSARAEWINLETMSIDVPAEYMKMKRPHRIPITPQIKKLLEQLPHSGWLFPSPQKPESGHITCMTLWKQFEPVRAICSVHGVRSVGRTWASENKVPFEVAEECLAHVRGNAVSRSYDRSDLLEERREVMTKWCEFVDSKRPR